MENINELEMEMDTVKRIKPCTTYAITWSPVLCPKLSYLEQLEQCLQTLKLLSTCCKTASIFPELNLNGQIHFHMEITVTNRTKFYKNVVPKMKEVGFIKIKDDVDSMWWVYLNKDRKMMEELLEMQLPLTLAHLDKDQILKVNPNDLRKKYERKKYIIDRVQELIKSNNLYSSDSDSE